MGSFSLVCLLLIRWGETREGQFNKEGARDECE